MQEIELSAGIIEYEDTGGSGPIVVLLHGLVMDGSLWRHVVRELRADHRCVVPTLPVGGHRRPSGRFAVISSSTYITSTKAICSPQPSACAPSTVQHS